MKIQALGHVVLKVSDQQRAEAFYADTLGLPVVARLDNMNMTFFSLGNHHDFAIAAVGDGPKPEDTSPGLMHVAFKIGDTLDDLREAKQTLEDQGVQVHPIDHGVSQSLYMNDPDGNMIELYVDVSTEWKTNPSAVAQIRPLDI